MVQMRTIARARMQGRRAVSAPRPDQRSGSERRSVEVLGNKARGAAIEKRNAVDTRCRERNQSVRVGRQACACAARGADAAHRSGVRRGSAITGIMVIAIAMLAHMFLGGCAAAVVRPARRHQFACIASQRQCREQQDEQQPSGKTFHGGDPIIDIGLLTAARRFSSHGKHAQPHGRARNGPH